MQDKKWFISDTHCMCQKQVHQKMGGTAWAIVHAPTPEDAAIKVGFDPATLKVDLNPGWTFPMWISDQENGAGIIEMC